MCTGISLSIGHRMSAIPQLDHGLILVLNTFPATAELSRQLMCIGKCH